MLILNHLSQGRVRFWRVYRLPRGRRSIQVNYAPVLGYTFDSTKVAKPIRQPILPKPWSNLEQLERAEQRIRSPLTQLPPTSPTSSRALAPPRCLAERACFSSLITICQMKHLFPLDSNFAKCEDLSCGSSAGRRLEKRPQGTTNGAHL